MMNPALRASVRERARGRCEYCRLHEDDEPSRVMLRENLLFEGRFTPDE
jgi:hypothetical protein